VERVIQTGVGGNELAKSLHFYGRYEQGDDNEFKVICPFHEDINASMKINLNNGSFYCFGCGVSGDAVKFVSLVNKHLDDLHSCMEYFKISRRKDVQAICIKHRVKTIQDNKQLQDEAHDYYFGLKTIDWNKVNGPEKDYMIKRGFSADSLNKCNAKLTYTSYAYPIIFPMNDMGEFCGWVCRTMSKTVEEKRKYLYNEGFSRRNTLVGNYDSTTVVLVEGFMDYLKMKQNGLKYVAAILGWKITEQQVSKLKAKGVHTIVSALDNDTCGKKGTQYLSKFFKVIQFQFPDGVKDPGDMDKKVFELAFKKTKQYFKGEATKK